MVGGLETSNNHRSGVVQIRDILQGSDFPSVCAQSFSPYVWRSGFHWLLAHFPSHPGRLTADELARAPKVILVGHSLGGWAVLSVARNLKRKGIPVELCVQIDSVGITDHTAPNNVKAAAIFHANDVMFPLTTKTIKLEDPSQTKLVENILVKDAGHWSVTRDPRVRNLVLCTVDSLVPARGQMFHCPSRPELSQRSPVTEPLEIEPIRTVLIFAEKVSGPVSVEARKFHPKALRRFNLRPWRKFPQEVELVAYSQKCEKPAHHSDKSRFPGTKWLSFLFLKMRREVLQFESLKNFGRLAQRLERPVYTRKVACSNHALPTNQESLQRGRSSVG